ncbi:MAG: nucleotide exchange factor GrpE [Bacteroidota bacterium]
MTDDNNNIDNENTRDVSPDRPSDSDSLQTKVDELQKSVEAYRDQLLRKAAEFENYKRRKETEHSTVIREANENLITSLLPILNDFVRSLRSGQETRDYDAFYKGVEMIYSKLNRMLEAQGLASLESLGQPFDVRYHDALLQVPRSDVPPQTVIEEVERGYKLNDKVLRHAKVIVSSPASGEDESTSVPANGRLGGEETN